MKLKILSATIAAFLLMEIHAKPLQETSPAKELKEPSNDLDVSKIDHKSEKTDTRVNRQIRILIDPNDLEEDDFENVNDDNNHNRITSRIPNNSTPNPSRDVVNIGGSGNKRRPQQNNNSNGGRGGIGGMISALMNGSSSGTRNYWLQKADTEERNARIRRQVEQLLTQIQQNMNQTKSQKQTDTESKSSEEEVPSNNSVPEDSESASSEEDEPPGGGDGQGGGILGLLAGLSGEGGQSDLGTLLTTVASIVSNLSGGEGFDLNALIGSAVGLLGGILAGDGMKNIGAQIGGYLITALDGITGGGASNNGAFFGNLAATVIGGTSAAGTGSSEEGGGGSDSGSFFLSLLSGFLGASSGRK